MKMLVFFCAFFTLTGHKSNEHQYHLGSVSDISKVFATKVFNSILSKIGGWELSQTMRQLKTSWQCRASCLEQVQSKKWAQTYVWDFGIVESQNPDRNAVWCFEESASNTTNDSIGSPLRDDFSFFSCGLIHLFERPCAHEFSIRLLFRYRPDKTLERFSMITFLGLTKLPSNFFWSIPDWCLSLDGYPTRSSRTKPKRWLDKETLRLYKTS